MMTDPIADMLTRIRNAGQAGHKWVDMPVSKKKIEIARLLEESHFVHAHKVLEDGRFGVLRVYLKYHDGKPVIRHLERVSRPGRRHYVGEGRHPTGAQRPRHRDPVDLARRALRPHRPQSGRRRRGPGGRLVSRREKSNVANRKNARFDPQGGRGQAGERNASR